MISYSTFNVGKCNEKNDRLTCPYFLYRGDESNLNRTKQLLWSFGLLQAITTAFIFFNYFYQNLDRELIFVLSLRIDNPIRKVVR